MTKNTPNSVQRMKLLRGKFSSNTYVLFTMRTVVLIETWLPWEVVESPLLETVKTHFDRVLEKVLNRRSDQVINRIPFQHLFHTVFHFCYRVEVHFLRYPQICINLLEANVIEEAGLKLTRRETLNPQSCFLHSPAACYILTPYTPLWLTFS